MRRIWLFVSAAVIVSAMGCSRGAAPTSPSRAADGPPAGTTTSSPSSTPVLFGASAVDFARCLQAAGDSGCFAASARMQTRAVGAAATAPGAPINLATASSGSTVTLTWGAPASGDPVTTYVIEAGSGPGLANLANVTTNSTATTFSASGVGAGTYYVRVRAQNATGTSAASNESILVVGSVACTSAPNAPASLATAVSGSTVTLTWSAPAGGCALTSYVLQAGSSAGASDLANANVGAATSYVAIAVGAGTYNVRVRAVNAYGQSAASNEVVLTVGGTPPPSSVTGRWFGTPPEGLVYVDPCSGPTEAALTLDLTQVNTSVTGTMTIRTTKVATGVCGDFVGRVGVLSLTGTVGAGTMTFVTRQGNDSMNGAATFTASRMTGTINGFAPFTVNRQ